MLTTSTPLPIWDQAAGGWKATSVACPHWSPNVWHHVQMYITTDQTNHTETYHTLIVDGVPYFLEMTYGVTNVVMRTILASSSSWTTTAPELQSMNGSIR